jgi:diguanylate cyclase (GGDEF)-like protein
MTGTYQYSLVLASLLIGFVTTLAAFALSSRIYRSQPKAAELWLLGGSAAIGSGIWASQFVSMLAFKLPIPVGYAFDYTFLSWLTALAVCWLALKIAIQPVLSIRLVIGGGILIGVGISGMNYIGMYAMHMSPAITYNPSLIVLSVILAASASTTVLFILAWLRTQRFWQAFASKILTAVVTALTITGTHYTAMTAAQFAPDAVSGAINAPNPGFLAMAIGLGVIILIFATRLESRTAKVGMSLEDANNELSRMAMMDTLTHLPNRRLFQQHLEVAIERSSRVGNSLAVAFIDLDGFKPINDAHGHHIGDEVLLAVAKRLNAAVRGCDVVARLGGDEFVALLEDIKSDQDIVPIVERIIHSLRDVFFIEHHEISISASVGIAVYPRDGDMKRLLVCADAAMYRAKSDGKNQFRFFDSDIELASDRLMEMQQELRTALSKDEFKLHFQPKIDGRTHALIGVEALLRWEHPTKGTIAPSVFLPAAERFGLINQIGDWVIEEACRILHRLRSKGIVLNISINLSAQQFRNASLVDSIMELLQRFDMPPSSLMFEITESSAMHNQDQFDSLLMAFRSAGIGMAMDDFGTGNSSLASLQTLKVNELKLDRTFTEDIGSNLQTKAIVEAIIKLAHALQLVVVAEGVETEEQRKTLVELGCDQMQGFLFARPVPEEKLAGLISQLASIKMDYKAQGVLE